MERWSEAEAQSWARSKGWICGCNFLPSTAVNFIEMWHGDTFDAQTISRELGWAAEVGFNAIRINLPFQGWQQDRDGLLDRFNQVMYIASRNGMATVPCLFDDCGFGGAEPVWGDQPDPLPDVHNGRAVASPGRNAVLDPSQRPQLEAYVRDIIGAFRTDDRVLFWDLYNEPGNRMIFEPSGFRLYSDALERAALDLMEDCFAWARSVAPFHPLTVAAWNTPSPQEVALPYQTDIDRSALAHSDIVTFHAYLNCARVAGFLDYLEDLRRPIICTEWMARTVDSRIPDQLAMFHARGVGGFQWGLVKGRTQTWLPWPEALLTAHGGVNDRNTWFHDLLEQDGTPYDPQEIRTIRDLTGTDGRTPAKQAH